MNLETPERKDQYAERFKHPEVLEIEGGTVEVVDLQPPPERLKTPVPLIVMPGWLGNVEVWEKTAVMMVKEGRRVIVVAAPHGVETGREDPTIPQAELRKAASFMRILDAKGIEKADVLTHSEGGVFMTAAALENPDRVRTLLYNAPVGLIGEDGFWKLAWRFFNDMAKETSEIKGGKGGEERAAQALTGQKAGGKALFKWPEPGTPGITHGKAALQALKEVIAMAKSQTQNNIRALHEAGVKIIIMHPVGDRVSPMSRMVGTPELDEEGKMIPTEEDRIKVEGAIVKADMVDGFLSVGDPTGTGEISDTHNSVFLSYKQFTAAIDSLLDTVERNIAKETRA